MNYQVQRAVTIGLLVAIAMAAGACRSAPSGVACGDRWCSDRELCVSVGQDVGMQSVCVAQDVCGNGIIEGDEACDCGDNGITSPDPACAGQNNSYTRGLCRKDCKLHCGDGVLDADEACDTQLGAPRSCVDLGYDFGRPSCSASCREITAAPCGIWNWQAMTSNTDEFLYNVWGGQPNNVFAIGSNGKIIHYDGTAWQAMNSTTTETLLGIWGNSLNEIFAVGDNGKILHYAGASWQAMDSTTLDGLRSVWGSSPNDVFAVGFSQVVLHYDGTAWQATDPSISDSLVPAYGVWGSGPGDVFVVGYGYNDTTSFGAISHYNGLDWEVMTIPDSQVLRSVWGSGAEDVFAVGELGTVLHYNGFEWASMNSGTDDVLVAVSGTGPDDVFTVGRSGTVLHYDGARWQTIKSGVAWGGVWTTGSSDTLLVGDAGTVLHYSGDTGTALHYSGSSWQQMDSGSSQAVTGIWGNRADDVFTVGDAYYGYPYANGQGKGGQILHYDGHEWTTVQQGIPPPLWGIWGCGPNQVFAVGGNAYGDDNGAVLRYDGESWAQMTGSPSTPLLSHIWGNSCSDIFVVGARGTILYYDGNQWSQMESGTQRWLSRVWGSGPNDVYAVGGVMLHYDGNRWQEIMGGTELPSLTDVWGSNLHDIFAVGFGGTVLHYDGSAWVPMKSGTAATLWSVWGTGPDDVYAVGDVGTLLHYDGHGWLPMRSGTTASFHSIWGDPSSSTLVIGGSKDQLIDEGVIYWMIPPRAPPIRKSCMVDTDCAAAGICDTGLCRVAASCAEILRHIPGARDGVYTIAPGTAAPFSAVCDMTRDSGGWTLLLKAAGDSTLGYSSSLWTDLSLLNTTDLTTQPGNAKYQSFLSLPVTTLRGELDGFLYTQGFAGMTAHQIFAGPAAVVTGFPTFNSGAPNWSTQPNCQIFGVNTPFDYARTRFGWSANEQDDCDSNDTAIGLGLMNDGADRRGAGYACAYTCSSGDVDTGGNGLLWAK